MAEAGRPRLGWEDAVRKDLREMGTSWEGVKKRAQADWCCDELSIVVSSVLLGSTMRVNDKTN